MGCRNCGREIVGRDRRALFCGRECKEKFRDAARSRAALLRRTDRVCPQCGRTFTPTRGHAVVCSRDCGVAWTNAKRQAVKKAKWLAAKQPCRRCGATIPDDKRAGSLYCSADCKKLARDARWRLRAPGYMRHHLYGITPEEYAALLDRQLGRCAICRADSAGGRGGWHVDHDHNTGKVRGLLCHSCNLGLGHLKDDPALLRAAMEYLAT